MLSFQQEKIGAGAFATIYRGTYTLDSINYIVAVKVINGNIARNIFEDIQQSLTFMLNHESPYLIRAYGDPKRPYYFSKNNQLCIAMDYMSQGDLFKVKKTASTSDFTWDVAFRLFNHSAMGILHLHGLGFAHRDIKPDNIFISDQWEAKLGDFDFQRQVKDDKTVVERIKGSPYYLAPEVLQKSCLHEDLLKSDIYAFGMLLFEIFFGDLDVFFKRYSMSVIYTYKLTQRFADLLDAIMLNESRPQGLRDLILNCINVNYHVRPTISQVIDQLFEIELIINNIRLNEFIDNFNAYLSNAELLLSESSTVLTLFSVVPDELQQKLVTKLVELNKVKKIEVQQLARQLIDYATTVEMKHGLEQLLSPVADAKQVATPIQSKTSIYFNRVTFFHRDSEARRIGWVTKLPMHPAATLVEEYLRGPSLTLSA